jgi:electron transfer flavoprotein beta subunit
MNILTCIKRVPATGANIFLTEDQQEIETRNLGFTISPHEECAVEEAVRLVEQHGGSSAVLTLGHEAAAEQLRDAMALGIDRAILLETDGSEWGPQATAGAITAAIQQQRDQGQDFDVLLFGNEAADSSNYQVGVRVAHALDLPCITGVKGLSFEDGRVLARREASSGWEVFALELPAVITVKEGINLPRYPSLPGRLKAKKKPIDRMEPTPGDDGLQKIRLKKPAEEASQVEVLGKGPEAATEVVALLKELRLM